MPGIEPVTSWSVIRYADYMRYVLYLISIKSVLFCEDVEAITNLKHDPGIAAFVTFLSGSNPPVKLRYFMMKLMM